MHDVIERRREEKKKLNFIYIYLFLGEVHIYAAEQAINDPICA
jgi:hypothetical protein